MLTAVQVAGGHRPRLLPATDLQLESAALFVRSCRRSLQLLHQLRRPRTGTTRTRRLQRFLISGRSHFSPPGRQQHDNLRIGSAVSILLYAVFAILLLERAGLSQMLPDAVAQVGTWVLTGYLTLGILLNAISRSKPERNLMTPVATVLAGLCLVVALG